MAGPYFPQVKKLITTADTTNKWLPKTSPAANSNLFQGKDTSYYNLSLTRKIKASDTARWGTNNGGSTIYANSGLYKDGDTIKSKYRVLKDFYVDSVTNGTSETDLYVYTLPANTLTVNGDKIIFTCFANADVLTGDIKFGVGASTIGNLSLSGSNNPIQVKMEIIRTTSSNLKIAIIDYSSGSIIGGDEVEGYDFTTTISLKLKCVATSGSLTAKFGYIEFKPAAQ